MKKLMEKLGQAIEGNLMEEAPGGSDDESSSVDLDAVEGLLDEAIKSEETIAVLRDTDYREKDAFFKMVELLKGLATVADEDETAKEFLSAVSDALTSAAEKVLGEDREVSEEKRPSQGSVRIFRTGGYGQPVKYNFSVYENEDSGKKALVDKGAEKTAKKAFDGAFKVCREEYGWE